ncbi:MAG TPA: glucosidase, partial [Verrucomicrobiae bacterium]|nr:glucosidase [Verrucomicrobiae bacterium]
RSHAREVRVAHETLGDHRFYFEHPQELLFTENETNFERIFNSPNVGEYVKDGINDYVVEGKHRAVNPMLSGTKAAGLYRFELAAGETRTIRARLCVDEHADPFGDFDAVFEQRMLEADAFYGELNDYPVSADEKAIQRQAFAGLLWNKQFYEYSVRDWLKGDPAQPPPPPERLHGRNADWIHLFSENVLSMPDNWEYPWFASWDLAFHCLAFSLIDPDFAKHQLLLLTREWYMHPNGQIPAYEWAFGDVNPPVTAWAALRIFHIEHRMTGRRDVDFLERVFQKLLLNFTWWVNRKDERGRNVFQGGFLGLDNIGLFDRGAPLPGGGHLDQSDGTSWMGVYTLNMLAIALELAPLLPAYEDIASKFFDHFLLIADAMNQMGGEEDGLWDEADGFYYDFLHAGGRTIPLRVRSMVGLIPLMAVEVFDAEQIANLGEFLKRVRWFERNRPDLLENVAHMNEHAVDDRRLMAIVDRDRLVRILQRMLDENEFLSPSGIRALSRVYREPYTIELDGMRYSIDYEPGESTSGLYGGNSNWRGPVWFPANYLLVEALQRFHYFYGDDLRVEFPSGSGSLLTLWEVASAISKRLIGIFTAREDGGRTVFGPNRTFQTDPLWRDLIPFYEYFNGDTGEGLGASHQTGWTALVAKLIQQQAEYGAQKRHPFAPG